MARSNFFFDKFLTSYPMEIFLPISQLNFLFWGPNLLRGLNTKVQLHFFLFKWKLHILSWRVKYQKICTNIVKILIKMPFIVKEVASYIEVSVIYIKFIKYLKNRKKRIGNWKNFHWKDVSTIFGYVCFRDFVRYINVILNHD